MGMSNMALTKQENNFETMEGLLEAFQDCDVMTLVTYNSPSELDLKISKEHADEALSNLKEYYKGILVNKYKIFYKKYNLIPFTDLFRDIYNECREFKNKHKKDDASKPFCFVSSFVGKSTKHSEPLDFFWHFYHSVEMLIDIEDASNNFIGDENVINILNKYSELRDNLVKYEITYNTYINLLHIMCLCNVCATKL